ncbi:hypothetical protein [Rhodococcus sp. NPDC049939]|uniref:hypothetical protein n=1 Tax=Rhodococcus sp. NPDC049939 TaxID=3155511 RepID=UPI003408AC4D
MNDDHAQVMEELRVLAETALDRLEPIVQRLVAPHVQESPESEPSGTGQWSGCAWCPVCALAALIRGEQHDLLTLLAEQATVLIALLRQLLEEHSAHGSDRRPDGAQASATGSAAPDGAPDATPAGGSTFVPIEVTIKP